MSNVNPGTKLFFSKFGGEQPIPPEFIAAMEREEEVQSVPNDVEPEALGENVVESAVETNRRNERVRRTVKKKDGDIVLRGVNTSQDGQPVQITRTLHKTSDAVVEPPSEFQTVAEHDLGNGWSIREVGITGNYVGGVFVPGIFLGKSYTRTRPDITPEEFRVVAQDVTYEESVVGQAHDPELVTNDLERRETQQTSFIKRTLRRFRDAVLGTTLTHYETDQDKELVAVERTLRDEGTPLPPDAFTDVDTINLGDGRMVETRKVRPEVFPGQTYATERPDLVPQEFRAVIPAVTTEVTEAGAAGQPALVTGELEHRETQVQKFVRRVRSVGRAAATLGTSLLHYETDRDKELLVVTQTLKAQGVPTSPDAFTDVQTINLGDGRMVETTAVRPEVFGDQTFEKTRPDIVPDKFKVAIPTETTETTSAGTAAAPTLGTGELSRQESQVQKFVKRVRVVFRGAAALGVSLVSYRTTRAKLLETVTTTYKLLTAPTAPSATKTVTTDNLGDGTMLEEVAEVAVFAEGVSAREVPDVVPPQFRVAIPTVTTETTLEGQVASPALTTGELEHTESQVDSFVKRVRSRMRGLLTLPSVILTSYRTNAAKQLVTVTQQIKATGTPTANTTTREVTVTNLGDGSMLEEIATDPVLFGNRVYDTTIPDLVPEEFRATVPVQETSVNSAGPALNPGVGTGELTHREEDINSFVRRVTTRFRSLVGLPITKVNTEITEEYGGAVLNVARTLAAGTQTLVGAFRRVRGRVTDLGNGTSLKEEADSTDDWPFLTGTRVVENEGVAEQITDQVVPAGTLGGVDYSMAGQVRINEVEPIDRWRSRQRGRIIYDANILSYRYTFPIVLSINLPRKLESVIAHIESNVGAGEFSSFGTLSTIGNGGTASANSEGSAEASASIGVDLEILIKEYFTDSVNGFEMLLYGLVGESIETVRARIQTFAGAPVSYWPKFTPKEHTFTCVGQEQVRTFRGQVNKSFATSFNYRGEGVGYGTGFSTGSGSSLRSGVTLKLVRIPPTVHGVVTVSGTISTTASAAGSIQMGIDEIVLPTFVGTNAAATCNVIPASLASTGVQVPTSGLYLYRLRGEPFRSKYIVYHATLVDFASVL